MTPSKPQTKPVTSMGQTLLADMRNDPDLFHRDPGFFDLMRDAILAIEREAQAIPAGGSVEALTAILDEAEGDGIIGPDYTPPRLATYIVDRLAATPPSGGTVEPTREELIEALVWMTGSDHFSPGGMAHEGFEKVVRPVLDKIASESSHECLMPSACGVSGFYCANASESSPVEEGER